MVKQNGHCYRVGVVGAGSISRLHLDGIGRHPDRMKVVALCDPDRATALKRAAEYGIKRTYSDVADMIAHAELDFAIVCTPTHVRRQVVLPLIGARIPTFCEKPFAETYAEAKEIEQAARAAHVPIAINQNFRRHFTFYAAREIITSNRLGRPLHLMQVAAHLRRDKGWRLNCKRYVMAVMSIHWFDGYRYLLQDEPENVYCQSINSPATDGGDDTAVSLILRFRKGTLVALSESFSSFSGSQSCSLDCEAGGLRLGYDTATEIRADGQKVEHKNPFDQFEASHWLLNDLVEAVENAREPETSAADNLKSMRILEAAYRSAEQKRLVPIEEVK